MALIILGLFVLIGVGGAIIYREFGFVLFAAMGFIFALMAGLLIDWPVSWATRDKVDITYELGALNDGRSTKGSFFLGSGSIDSVPSFMYYVKDGDGFVLRDWPARSSKVIETDSTPRVVYRCDDYGTVPRPFRWTTKMMEDSGWVDEWIDCGHAFVTFYVPPGSVKQQYNLDAQ